MAYCSSTRACLPYFASLGYTPVAHINPLDFLLDISTIDARDEGIEQESSDRVKRLLLCWKEYKLRMDEVVTPVEEPKHLYPGSSETFPILYGSTPSLTRYMRDLLRRNAALLARASKNAYRAYPELVGHFLQGIVLGVLMGLTFFQLGEQPSDIQSLKTLSFQLVPVYGYMTQVIWTYRWCQSLTVFDREREDHLYSPLSWVATEFLAWLPVNIVVPSIYAVLVYFVSRLRTDDLSANLGILVADFILVQLSFVSWGLLAGSLVVSSVLFEQYLSIYSLSVLSARLRLRLASWQLSLSLFHSVARIFPH